MVNTLQRLLLLGLLSLPLPAFSKEAPLIPNSPAQAIKKPDSQKPPVTKPDNADEKEADDNGEEKVPKNENNPFADPKIDELILKQTNDDLWLALKGGLPCLELSRPCLEQLQAKAIEQSPLLKEVDTRIQEANQKAEEAKVANKQSINLSILTPGLQYLLNTQGETVNGKKPGLFDRIGGLFRGDLGIVNDLFRVIGIPLFDASNGGNADTKGKAIAISDLQVKIAELQRGRAELADKIKEKVSLALVAFDDARAEYQMAQIVVKRSATRFEIYRMKYIRGKSTTEEFLQKQNELDKSKSQVYGSWAKMRRSLFSIKLLVLTVKDADV